MPCCCFLRDLHGLWSGAEAFQQELRGAAMRLWLRIIRKSLVGNAAFQ